MIPFSDITQEYSAICDFLSGHLEEVQEEEVRKYCTAAILKIWGSNQLYSHSYREALNAVFEKKYTLEQVLSAMSCCSDPERRLQVPGFFRDLVGKDGKDHTHHTEDLINQLNSLFVGLAMVNGDFTIEEAHMLSTIMRDLTRFARRSGITIGGEPDNQEKITAKNESSYLQNDALLDAITGRETRPSAPKVSDQPSAEPAPVINLNINIGGSDEKQERTTYHTQSAPPEEAARISRAEEEAGETMESLLAELDSLVGLENVKQDVHSLINFIKVTKIREKRGMRVPTISYHLVFTGNPGTGKTTVARLVAKLYYHMGILPQGQLVETDRSALVAGYLGQTAIKTQKVIQQAMGGVLFIDEAYSLAGETDDSYGKEAIETILKAMEDHRDELVVIVAGYTELMHKFIDSNPGLSSRFSKYFEYPDYTGEELLSIFQRFCEKNGYKLSEEAEAELKLHLQRLYETRDEHFGNARAARNIFEKAINEQANRIAVLPDLTDEDLENITAADIRKVTGGAL